METGRPWRGVLVAVTTPFRADLSVAIDQLQEHVRWLAAEGCHGFAPCVSMGEYRALSDDERATVVRATVEAAPAGCAVLPGVGGYGSRQARRWAEQAAEAGAHGVLARPPDGPAARDADVVAHYREVAAVGLPVVAHNEPCASRIDLTPDLLATVAEIDGIVAVKEVTGDVRRLHRLRDLCPHVDVLVGADDVALELVLCGATGWVAALPNALPRHAVRLYELGVARDLGRALPLYAELHPILGWATRPESVQAVKLAMACAGRFGGRCRPPRGPLPVAAAERVRRDVLRALAATVEPASGGSPG
ncbi:dihydrodipicolinate synthase family protein [Micromonospora chokoriensis]|uniref:4-hydroxy-tetrahydrodipicolinate synthase n=1 Tax=Micromonospora chokoriensis TaxID=356851 RepID=A0A1C4YPG5_9ACTN|nr:dihydrodipicolinate synthase family protein [Micromonospora chokoriensis]SCF22672.1 4-hydroxy-tetrahydrodipicolinate synthase [Micromonospora chokoriensis]